MSMTLESLLDTLEKLATRNHDRACQHLADTRLQCNCGTALHNAKVKGTAIRMGQMLKDDPTKMELVGQPTANVTLTQGVKVATPIPGSPALTPPQRIQQSPSVDIPTRTAGPAVEEPTMPPVQTPQELRAIMESDTPSPAEPYLIVPPVQMPVPPGEGMTSAPPPPPQPAPKRVVGHGPSSMPGHQKRLQKQGA